MHSGEGILRSKQNSGFEVRRLIHLSLLVTIACDGGHGTIPVLGQPDIILSHPGSLSN